jgi:hypothetical protein
MVAPSSGHVSRIVVGKLYRLPRVRMALADDRQFMLFFTPRRA